MKTKNEIEATTNEILLDWIISELKKFKPGAETSIKSLLDSYFYSENYHNIIPNDIYEMVFTKSREDQILLDESKNYGVKRVLPYKQSFVVWNKRKYMSDDLFRSLCETYDMLYISLDFDDDSFEKEKNAILSNWRKECRIFKKDPDQPVKPKKISRIKDLDRTPFAKPVIEKLEKKNINVIPVGSGSKGNSMYVEMGDHIFLIDCGMPLSKVKNALEKNGRNLSDIQAIFITHGHSDHISGVKTIAKELKCPIFTSSWVKNDLAEMNIESIELEPYKRHEVIPNLFVTMFKADHDYIMTYGFAFETNNAKLSYLTDNGYTNEKRLREMYGSDVAILEANFDLDLLDKSGDNELTWRVSVNHSSNIRCGYSMISLHEKGTRNFIIGHLSKRNNKPELVMDTLKTMLRERYAQIHICSPESDELLKY